MKLFILLYLVGFLRTLVIIVLIYLGIRLFTRYILPMLVDKGMKNMQQKMYEQQRENQRSGKKEGEVTVEKKSNSKYRNHDDDEYVDFEEVDD